MSKSVLILDTPNMCDNCMFHYNTYDENDCFVDKCMVLKDDKYNDMTIDGYTDRYFGCPLREVPEKKEKEYQLCRRDSMGNIETYGVGVNKIAIGYNQCIDDILGE